MPNSYFEDLYINFENNLLKSSIPLPLNNAYFGILKLVAPSCDITLATQELIFVIDRSGSMSDPCSDGRTKMQHIIHTLKNMILYLKEHHNNIHFFITIFAFDNKFSYVIKRTDINNDNIDNILKMIDSIRPLGSTNIEYALTNVKEYIDELKDDFPTHIISHIFMTDGEATDGNTDYPFLKNLVQDTITNIFVGFGINHDSALLNYISSKNNSSYYFIDILEKAGLVYGEILHSILYKYLDDVEIQVTNGYIYNYKSNEWTSKLSIGNIVGEANKTYHMVSDSPDVCSVIIIFNKCEENILLDVPKLIDVNVDYTKYIYRQKTLELLYEVSQNQNNVIDFRNNIFSQVIDNEVKNDLNLFGEKEKKESCLKNKLVDLIKDIKNYMESNHLNEDHFLKNLCDDIYISYKTIGTRYGAMYTCARQVSQGNQRCYTVTQTPTSIDDETEYSMNIPKLSCNKNIGNNYNYDINNDNVGNDNINNNSNNSKSHLKLDKPQLIHNLSDFNDIPYLTPTATKMMRDVSADVSNFIKNPCNSGGSNISDISYYYSSDEDDNLFTFLTKK